jgi:hypothetical protein
MARIWRKPGVLMTAYVVLYAITVSLQDPMYSPTMPRPTADAAGVALAAFLAWRVTRGGAVSRVLIIVYTAGWVPQIIWGPDMKSGGLVSLGLLAVLLVQIALLVSTPIYERTPRTGPTGHRAGRGCGRLRPGG